MICLMQFCVFRSDLKSFKGVSTDPGFVAMADLSVLFRHLISLCRLAEPIPSAVVGSVFFNDYVAIAGRLEKGDIECQVIPTQAANRIHQRDLSSRLPA